MFVWLCGWLTNDPPSSLMALYHPLPYLLNPKTRFWVCFTSLSLALSLTREIDGVLHLNSLPPSGIGGEREKRGKSRKRGEKERWSEERKENGKGDREKEEGEERKEEGDWDREDIWNKEWAVRREERENKVRGGGVSLIKCRVCVCIGVEERNK